jgi:hypothetical protein
MGSISTFINISLIPPVRMVNRQPDGKGMAKRRTPVRRHEVTEDGF